MQKLTGNVILHDHHHNRKDINCYCHLGKSHLVITLLFSLHFVFFFSLISIPFFFSKLFLVCLLLFIHVFIIIILHVFLVPLFSVLFIVFADHHSVQKVEHRVVQQTFFHEVWLPCLYTNYVQSKHFGSSGSSGFLVL